MAVELQAIQAVLWATHARSVAQPLTLRLPPAEAGASMEDSPGPHTARHFAVDENQHDEGADIMRGQLASVIARASSIMSCWSAGLPGRAPMTHRLLDVGDCTALGKRQCTEQNRGSFRPGQFESRSPEAREASEEPTLGSETTPEADFELMDMELVETAPGQPDASRTCTQPTTSASVQPLGQFAQQGADLPPGDPVAEDSSDSSDIEDIMAACECISAEHGADTVASRVCTSLVAGKQRTEIANSEQ